MSSKVLEPTDYRYGLGDKYGRRECSNCGRFRRINAYWKDTNKVLCIECSHTSVSFLYSVGRPS